MRPALFLDRDGVLIEDRVDFVRSWADVEIFPRSVVACRLLTEAGIPIAIATNQSLVGRGFMSLDEVTAINEKILDVFREAGAIFLGAYICPHAPQDGCDCRKPKPGLLLRAAAEHRLDLSRSVLVGDSLRDVQAAQAAGVKGNLVLTGKGAKERSLIEDKDKGRWPVFEDLLDAVPAILHDLRVGA